MIEWEIVVKCSSCKTSHVVMTVHMEDRSFAECVLTVVNELLGQELELRRKDGVTAVVQ